MVPISIFRLIVLLFSVLSTQHALAFHQMSSSRRILKSSSLSSASALTMALNMAAPATIEREKTVERTGGEPAVVDRPSTKKNRNPEKERQREGGETWEVRIYNDGTNTREHVARSLVQITGMAEMTAYQTMMMAHQNGIASVGLFCFEIAESYNDGLRKQGIVSDIIPVDEDFQ